MKKFIQLTELKGNYPEKFSTGKQICIQKSRISYFESAYDLSYEEIQQITVDTIRGQALRSCHLGSRIVLIDTENGQPKEFYVLENPNEILSKM